MTPPMTPEHYDRLEAIFQAAVDLPPGEREAFLDAECGSDRALRAEVQALLQADETTPTQGVGIATLEGTVIPEAWGNYRVLEVLGSGGMGTVYRAEQQRPKRIVALKVIRGPFASPELLRRFESEAEILGTLRHDGIAQIYEAGQVDTAAGPLPFIAMEWIDGVSLLEYVERTKPNLVQRLRLLQDLCDAARHAHQRGVIHRDLKPDNVLVTSGGQVKLLDFGIARVADSTQRSLTLQTEAGKILGTLPYMSPEQLSGSGDVDIRTDVYSLGVIGYQLLAGRLPLELNELSLTDAIQVIERQDPRPLGELDRSLRGDLETVIGKALAKDADRRYESAGALSQDIGRYLKHEAVQARPPSSIYLLSRFTRRNRGLVTAASLILLSLVAGLIGTTFMAGRAAEQRDFAEEQREVADAVNVFWQTDLLGQANPMHSVDRSMKLRDALDNAAQGVGERFQDRPRLEAPIRVTIAQVYISLGLYQEALTQLEQANTLYPELLPAHHIERLVARYQLIRCQIELGDYEHADRQLERFLEELPPEDDEEHRKLRDDARFSLAALHLVFWRHVERENLLRELVQESQDRHGVDHDETRDRRRKLARVLMSRGDYPQALEVLEAETEGLLAARGSMDHPVLLVHRRNIESCWVHMGENRAAEPRIESLVEDAIRVLGPDHDVVMSILRLQAIAQRRLGKRSLAEPLMERVLLTRRRVLGNDHPDTLQSVHDMALFRKEQRRYDEAEALYLEAKQGLEREFGSGHLTLCNLNNNLAALYRTQRRYDEALSITLANLTQVEQSLGPEHPITLRTRSYLGFIYRRLDRLDDAEAQYSAALAGQSKRLGDRHHNTMYTLSNYAYLCRLRGQSEKSEQLYQRVIAAERKTFGPAHRSLLKSLENLGSLYLETDRPKQALPLYEEVWEKRKEALGTDAILTVSVQARLWRALNALERNEEALRTADDAVTQTRGFAKDPHQQLAQALYQRGVSGLKLKRYEAAERDLLEARQLYGPDINTKRDFTGEWLHALYRETNRPAEAERYPPPPTN